MRKNYSISVEGRNYGSSVTQGSLNPQRLTSKEKEFYEDLADEAITFARKLSWRTGVSLRIRLEVKLDDIK